MPIQFIEGPPRAGKTHFAVKERIIYFLRKKVVTVTDVAGLNPEEIAKYLGWELDEVNKYLIIKTPQEIDKLIKSKELLYHPEKCPNALLQPGWHLCLDELWRYWPAGQKLNDIESEFFPYHGHYTDNSSNSIELTLISQAKAQVAKEIHPLIEARYKFRKMKFAGKPTHYQYAVYDGNNRSFTTLYDDAYDPKIFPLYKSANGTVGDDYDPRRSIYNTLKFKIFKQAKWMIPLGVIFAGYTFYNLFQPKQPEAAPAPSAAATSGVLPVVPGQPAPPALSNPVTVDGWRVVASYQVNQIPVYIVVDGLGRYRTIQPSQVRVGAPGEVYIPIPKEDDSATPWAGKNPTFSTQSKNKN